MWWQTFSLLEIALLSLLAIKRGQETKFLLVEHE